MGAKVVLTGRDKSRLDETLSLMTGEGHMVCQIDLTDYPDVERGVKLIIDKVSKINGVINCAGISTTIQFSLSGPDMMEKFFRTNVIGGMNITRHIIKRDNFASDGGSIVFISSVMGSAGETGKTLYSITKGGLEAGVRSLALEHAPRKIRINSVSPGVVETPMSRNAVYSRNEESLNKIKSFHPLGLGQPVDVANTCVFLLSDAARWITGTNLIVDGGYLAR
jgi:NAD(P)-dependent dehydrogenase (short-subunit alcohol dehydrogenase family)